MISFGILFDFVRAQLSPSQVHSATSLNQSVSKSYIYNGNSTVLTPLKFTQGPTNEWPLLNVNIPALASIAQIQGLAKLESIMWEILALSPYFQRMSYFLWMNFTTQYTMNTKYFSCAYQLQCNVVLIAKFNLVTCKNLSSGNNKNNHSLI